jgi:hypothetical protein
LASVEALLADILSRLKGSQPASGDETPDPAPPVVEPPEPDASSLNVIRGTAGDDDLDGTAEDDLIIGRAGDDSIDGAAGNDQIQAGSGADIVNGGDGDDRISGGSGDDELSGGAGDDVIRAGSGDDLIAGGAGDDRISLGSGEDRVVFSGTVNDDVIADFRVGTDVIDLTAFTAITSLDQLTFTQVGASTVISAPGIDGTITVRNVTVSELRDGGSVLVACYLRGTMILTPGGERAIEDLQIGDEVVTADGDIRPIRWIGYRAYAARFLKAGSRLLPVTFRAGSLGPSRPNRDLTVSPGHSMLIDGKLVNANLLVNGRTIVQGATGPMVSYVHIELDTPDAVIANGVASETYVNDANRRQFENWQSYLLRYGRDEPAARRADGTCEHRFPRVAPGAELAALRARVWAGADQSGAGQCGAGQCGANQSHAEPRGQLNQVDAA